MSRVAATVILDSLSRAEREMESEMMPTAEWAETKVLSYSQV